MKRETKKGGLETRRPKMRELSFLSPARSLSPTPLASLSQTLNLSLSFPLSTDAGRGEESPHRLFFFFFFLLYFCLVAFFTLPRAGGDGGNCSPGGARFLIQVFLSLSKQPRVFFRERAKRERELERRASGGPALRFAVEMLFRERKQVYWGGRRARTSASPGLRCPS